MSDPIQRERAAVAELVAEGRTDKALEILFQQLEHERNITRLQGRSIRYLQEQVDLLHERIDMAREASVLKVAIAQEN